MDAEERASQQIADYAELAKDNKKINAAALMINALQQAQAEEADHRKRRQAYWVSAVLPPLGLLIAGYYILAGKPDGKRIAVNCVIFTLISLLIAWGIGALMFSSLSSDQTAQIQNVNADAIKQMLQP